MKQFIFRNGDQMPLFGLGTWKSAKGEVYKAVLEALRLGYRHIDCAAIYRNEEEIGEAFDEAFSKGLVKREELWVTSKLWNTEHQKEHVQPALTTTLKDLKLDYLDLYLMHWPVVMRHGVISPKSPHDFQSLKEVPLSQTWSGMTECVKAGLIRHIGVSNFSVKKLRTLIDSEIPPEMNQIELHPLLQQNDVLGFCKQHHIGLTAYSPLGSRDRPVGLIKEQEPNLFENPVINDIAKVHDCSPAQILIAWAINRGTAVIPKSINPERLKQNFEASFIVLTELEMAEIAKLDQHYRYLDGSFWVMEGNPYTLQNLWDE
ncbi:MAG: aldo/keto reductase [Bacteroidota bacterium]